MKRLRKQLQRSSSPATVDDQGPVEDIVDNVLNDVTRTARGTAPGQTFTIRKSLQPQAAQGLIDGVRERTAAPDSVVEFKTYTKESGELLLIFTKKR